MLAQLTQQEFDAGMSALRSYANTDHGLVTEPIDIFVFRA
jgi:hypothetical protein